jgi:hypothetical protein
MGIERTISTSRQVLSVDNRMARERRDQQAGDGRAKSIGSLIV